MIPVIFVSYSEILDKWGETLTKESSGEVDVWNGQTYVNLGQLSPAGEGFSYL